MKLAAQRYLRMLRRTATDPDCPYYFSPAHAVDFLNFWELCPVGDNWQGVEFVRKEPFQIWFGCALYGFRRKGNSSRWVNWVYLEIPRKHDKSGTAAVVGLYDMVYTTSKHPQILIGAASERQAEAVFRRAAYIVFEESELQQEHSLSATDKMIRCGANRGVMEKVASIPKNQDGWNPSTILLDELHSQNPGVYQVLKSAMGARSNQLMLQITTAGRHAFGLGWDERANAIRVLEGKNTDDRLFALIFTVDADELEDQKRLLTDEKIWIKANPMWGVSVNPEEIRSYAGKAVNSPIDREEFLRTRLNVWSNAASGLVDPQAWAECQDDKLDITQMFGRRCWIGVDLSHYKDMSAIALIFEEYRGRVPVFCRFFLPESSPTLLSPNLHAHMMEWAERGFLIIQPGGLIDRDAIAEEIKAYHQVFDVQEVAYDKEAGGAEMMKRLWDEGYEKLVDYPNRPATLTAPTEDLLALIHSRKLVHDGNECLRWNFLNVVGDHRANGTLMPKKDAPNSERKIDGFIATVLANALRMGSEAGRHRKPGYVDPYLERGLLGWEQVNG